MVDGFTTIFAISVYHHWSCEFEFRSGEVYSIQHYVIVCQWFSPGTLVSFTNKTDRHDNDITEILLKVAGKYHKPSPKHLSNEGIGGGGVPFSSVITIISVKCKILQYPYQYNQHQEKNNIEFKKKYLGVTEHETV